MWTVGGATTTLRGRKPAGSGRTTLAVAMGDALGSRLVAGATMVVALLAPLLVGTPTVAAESFGDVGYEDASFSPAAGNITGEKPESKLWWNDGSWWASMIAPADEAHHSFRLDGSSQTWTDTGVQLAPGAGSRADVLW